MTTQIDQTLQILDITNYLIEQERKLWEQLQVVDRLFEKENINYKLALARWSTANQMKNEVLTITNNN